MNKQLGSQGTSESMWPVRSGGSREEQTPLAAEDALRAGSHPAHDVLDRGVPLSSFQWPSPSADPGQWLRSDVPATAAEAKADAIREEVEVAAPLEDSGVKFAPPKLPEWFWGGSPAKSSERVQATPDDGQAAQKREETSGVASRLSALRGAVSALGMKSLGRRKELPAVDIEKLVPRPAQEIEPETGTGARIEIPAGLAEEVQVQSADARAAVTAVPEKVMEAAPQTVAPREFVPVKKRETADGWDDDDVRILPARRGQYKP